MTTRKSNIPLTYHLTAYVTREEGAAELRVSPSTWDEMVECGQIPPCRVASAGPAISCAGAGPTWTIALVAASLPTISANHSFEGLPMGRKRTADVTLPRNVQRVVNRHGASISIISPSAAPRMRANVYP